MHVCICHLLAGLRNRQTANGCRPPHLARTHGTFSWLRARCCRMLLMFRHQRSCINAYARVMLHISLTLPRSYVLHSRPHSTASGTYIETHHQLHAHTDERRTIIARAQWLPFSGSCHQLHSMRPWHSTQAAVEPQAPHTHTQHNHNDDTAPPEQSAHRARWSWSAHSSTQQRIFSSRRPRTPPPSPPDANRTHSKNNGDPFEVYFTVKLRVCARILPDAHIQNRMLVVSLK